MRRIIILLVLIWLSVLLFPGKLAQLAEISTPNSMTVEGNQLFIIEKETVFLYSMKDFKLVKTFGRKGEGPGEFGYTPTLRVYPEFLVFNSFGKILYFSRNGEFIKEKRSPSTFSFSFEPMGDKFVGFKVKMNQETQKSTTVITFFDKDLKAIKELATRERQLFRQSGGKIEVNGVSDHFGFDVWGERIFVADTTKGFYIEVINSSGDKLYEIKKEYQKMKVSEEYKKDFWKRMEANPTFRTFKDRIKVVFRDYFPAFRNTTIKNGKMYVVCFEKKDKNNLIIVMDLKGKILKKSFLPTNYRNSIYNDRFYFLVENEDEEIWELFVKDI